MSKTGKGVCIKGDKTTYLLRSISNACLQGAWPSCSGNVSVKLGWGYYDERGWKVGWVSVGG
jgi:hypothetical protein